MSDQKIIKDNAPKPINVNVNVNVNVCFYTTTRFLCISFKENDQRDGDFFKLVIELVSVVQTVYCSL